MNSFFLIVFGACLVHQGSSVGYWVNIVTVTSIIDNVSVKTDNSNKTIIVVNKDRTGYTFKASILQNVFTEKGPVEGVVCDTDPNPNQAFIIKILFDLVGADGCPVAVGEYPLISELIYRTDTFTLLKKGFRDASLRIGIKSHGNENAQKDDIIIWGHINELTDSELDALGKKKEEK
ncbi:uncharacterized protein [Fopius arisanus]|uniref:Uncharacterized protein isoform X1 n=1 Tax=Fopius arisanus TaxID=64838 RepID=A0A0C9RBT5_9HYME|nr:PREDICTED: uncharacterized protein LOC105272044 isoform X1 [Fopius arisanus]